jgi:hypothetical protein
MHDRIDLLINRLKHGHMQALPSDVLIVVQENVRLARRMLDTPDMDVTAASIARNAIAAACDSLDSYAGMRT